MELFNPPNTNDIAGVQAGTVKHPVSPMKHEAVKAA
jgi:hypothetical protein